MFPFNVLGWAHGVRKAKERRDELLANGEELPWTLDLKWWQGLLVVVVVVGGAALYAIWKTNGDDA